MNHIETSVENFLDQLASGAATPGGGSAAAVMGAMGAALVSMVANLTIGKPKYAGVEDEIKTLLEQSETLRTRLTSALQDDIHAYNTVMAAYDLPKDTDQEKVARNAAIQAALKQATEAPLACARLALEVIPLAKRIAGIGNINAISDGGVAAIAAQAALRSALLNVFVNTAVIKDKAFCAPCIVETEHLLAKGAALETEVFTMVKHKILH